MNRLLQLLDMCKRMGNGFNAKATMVFALLMMVSIGARADVKVFYGDKGSELESADGTVTIGQKEGLTGGTILITQEDQDGTCKLTISVTPSDDYTLAENGLEVYAVAPADISFTRAVTVSDKLDLATDDFKDISSKRTYTATIDSKLALWVKSVTFNKGSTPTKEPRRATNENDYSGAYFIRNMGKNANASNIYYLCPTEGWAYYEATNKVTATDNGQPFLTTYKCKDGVYDASKAVWIVEKHPEIDAYYIKQNKTGRYMVSNGQLTGAGANRVRVHLEAVADAAALSALGDLALFEINYTNGNYNIFPHSTAGRNGSSIYLVANNGNFNQLTGEESKKDGPTGYKNCGGIIGLYSYEISGDWQFEDVVSLPTIADNGDGTVTITNPNGGGIIYYTIDGETPSESSSSIFTAAGTVTLAANQRNVVKAVVMLNGVPSRVASRVVDLRSMTDITSLSEITESDGIYRLSADISSAGNGFAITFTGTLDGNFHTISGLSGALFQSADGAVIKNVTLADVNISGSDNVGAICNEATGATKIYNCGVLSGSVSGGTNVGGLVGLIKSGSNVRVVNCYNYANVSGSGCAAGIVGKNEGSVDGATTLTGTGVRIAMCMMYGSVSGATNISPVYTGNHVDNVSRFTEYNYYLYSNERDATGNIVVKVPYTAYNDQQAIAKEEYLTRFPFYRHILNTHRELASYFLFSDYAHVDEIGHWAIKPGRDYPIVEQWEKDTKRTTIDIKDNLPNTTNDYAGKLLTSMGTGGYLTVNVTINGSSFTSQLPITDMDTLRYDYTYGKVVLPFANEYSGWTRDYDYICTGWKITSAGGATSFSAPNHDHADRSNKQKDIYDASDNPYVFAQGGYYIVPDGVTSINIEANFARAYYLSDEYYDIGYGTSYNATVAGLGGFVPQAYHGKTVYTNLNTLLSAMSESKNPNSQAIALVGNFHYNVAALGGVIFNSHTGKALTIMSVDEDNNQEPDYGWYTYMNETSRPDVPALRFDFVPNIGIGMAAHVKGSSYYPNISIWKAHGWFELTETALSLMNQCEIDSRNFPAQSEDGNTNRWIVNSGYFTQIVRSYNNPCDRLRYIQIGGNAYVKEFYPGNHSTKSHTNPIIPINVTGGEIEECCMTGYHVGGKAKGDNIYFWCAGGKIHKFLGAYMETPINSSDKQENVNLTAKVDHALISKFFGGGTSSAARITGNISVTISNSKVDFYCGGPEFGDMATGKTVTTSATNTVFNNYYGAGFGGTSLTYVFQNENQGYAMGAEVEYDRTFTNYTGDGNRLNYNATYGIGTCYKFEFIPNSVGQKVVARIYLGRSQFSLASTGSVENTLNNCTVEEDFYGAGCQGTVNGNVVSNLTDCKIKGNAYGGGYKAESNKLPVYPTTIPTYSKYYGETGIFSEFGKVEPEEWEWVQGTSTDKNKAVEAEKKLYTDEANKINMADLGNVTGDISITIGGDSKIGTDGDNTTGSVYGGGNESKSLANTTVTLKGNTEVLGDVFGGGNRGLVEGSATVNITE